MGGAQVLQNYDQWSLKGQAVVIKYYDSDGDGRLDMASVVEVLP